MGDRSGYERLWGWFGLSRASFCVMPRVLMHEMPDEWQDKMAALLEEYQATFKTYELPACRVMAQSTRGSRFASWPEWLLNYRRPLVDAIETLRHAPCETCGKLDHECPCVGAMLDAVKREVGSGC